MTLDPCLKGRKPFTCLAPEEAQPYLKKPCFFCDEIQDLTDITSKCHLGYLVKISSNNFPFLTTIFDWCLGEGTQSFRYCIPFKWLCENANLDMDLCEDKVRRDAEIQKLTFQRNLLLRYDAARRGR